MFLWAILILAALWLIYGVNHEQITPIGQLTPTSTRAGFSYASEGDAYFALGKLNAAVAAYQKAIEVDPNDAQVWARLARIQTYSSELLTTDEEKRAVLQAALSSIDQANALAPDDSTVAAIRAFVLDWNVSQASSGEKDDLLFEAEKEAARARQLDNTNILALAYYAEILIDQGKLAQAEQYILLALDGGQDLMDVHRVYAQLLESQGAYNDAIEEWVTAIDLTPNLTFLYRRAGANYRQLAFSSTIDVQATALYEKSLEYFDKAAKINEQLGVNDPTPYLSISRTYSQMGEYFAAGRNVQKALDFKPTDADIYGQLGIIFFRSRNYEGAIPALKCAVRGCTAEESCDGRYGRACDPDFGEAGVEVRGLPLSQNSIVYYYTYGSVLAALSRPKQNYCPEAVKVFQEVRAVLTVASADEPTPVPDRTIIQIVEDGEAICRLVGQPAAVRTTLTPLGTALESSSITETPTPGNEQ